MDMVTYKAIGKLWKFTLVIAGCGVLYGVAMNHNYKKLKKQIADVGERVNILEQRVLFVGLGGKAKED